MIWLAFVFIVIKAEIKITTNILTLVDYQFTIDYNLDNITLSIEEISV